MLGMISGAASGLLSSPSAQLAAKPAQTEDSALDAVSTTTPTAEAPETGASESAGTSASESPAPSRAQRAASADAPAQTASPAQTTQADSEEQSADSLASSRAQAIAAQDSFMKSLLVASMNGEAEGPATELAATPSRGAESYAAARNAGSETPAGKGVQA
ncbi:hypothetical protein KUV62_02280 [Salipiger bermudensis]|uniref:hypothetical protein n=1 Tax=Salipiger bermudensis TaxID=344736 RepID=UPI001C9970D3|nr:hypothetical protein [Salipiger bermudensis]MBY6002716.1 hypothetical protein [Salipiger bermudensis]